MVKTSAAEYEARERFRELRDWPGVSMRYPMVGNASNWQVLPSDVQWRFASEGAAALFATSEEVPEVLTPPKSAPVGWWQAKLTVRQLGGGEQVGVQIFEYPAHARLA